MVLLQLMAPKPKSSKPTSAASNTSSPGNPKVIAKAKQVSELREILKPDTKLEQAHNIARSIVLAKGGYSAAMNTYKFGKTVIHGSPTKNLETIQPRTGSVSMPKEEVVYSFNPKSFKGEQGVKRVVGEAKTYVQQHSDEGSIYVGKVPRSAIRKSLPDEAQGPGHIVSDRAIKVSKEYDIKDPKIVEKLKKDFPKKDTQSIKDVARQRALKKQLKTPKGGNIA